MTISHALEGCVLHKHFLRDKSNVTLIRTLIFPVLFTAYVHRTHHVCALRSSLSPVRNPWEHPSHGPMKSKCELSLANVRSSCVKISSRHTCVAVWHETRRPSWNTTDVMAVVFLSCCFPVCELRWDFYVIFTDHLALLLKVLLDGTEYRRIFYQGSGEAKCLEKLSEG